MSLNIRYHDLGLNHPSEQPNPNVKKERAMKKNTTKAKAKRAQDKSLNKHANIRPDDIEEILVQFHPSTRTLYLISEDGTAVVIPITKKKAVEILARGVTTGS